MDGRRCKENEEDSDHSLSLCWTELAATVVKWARMMQVNSGIRSNKWLAWVCVLAWMCVIFAFSAQAHSGEITEQYLGSFNVSVRKIAHMFEYFVLCGLLRWAYSATIVNLRNPRAWLYPFLTSALYAMTDEFHQSFVPGRSCTAGDVGVDSAGALIFCIAFHYFAELKSFWSKTRN